MSAPISLEIQIDRLIQGQRQLQHEIEENKRGAEADLKRVKDDAEEEIRRVREKADADAKANAAAIEALEVERTKALKWGVMTLGTAVIGMATWITNKIIGGQIQ